MPQNNSYSFKIKTLLPISEIEKNKRMGMTRDLFKKVRNTKGIFHEEMRTIDMDLTEAEDIKNGW